MNRTKIFAGIQKYSRIVLLLILLLFFSLATKTSGRSAIGKTWRISYCIRRRS